MDLSADELLERIRAGEGTRTEFKRGLPRAEKVARTLAAFANTKGGLFCVGVGDRGELLGAPEPPVTAAELRTIAAHHVDPPVPVHVQVVRLEGRPIVVALVPASEARPHTALGPEGEREVTIRHGASTRAATGAALRALAAAPAERKPRAPLEREALEWLQTQRGRGTVDGFAAARNIGRTRARQVFVALERAGLVVGHGTGARREYAAPSGTSGAY